MASDGTRVERPGAGAPDAARVAGDSTRHEPVTLVKGAHRWTFSCDQGCEAALLQRISELAGAGVRDGTGGVAGAGLDWFDAALVSHQLRHRLRPGLHRSQERNESDL